MKKQKPYIRRRITIPVGGLPIKTLLWERQDEPGTGKSGPGLLLVHGFLDCADNWTETVQHLRRMSHGYPLIAAIDLRGHGRSGHMQRGGIYHFSDYQWDIARTLQLLGQSTGIKSWVLAGHSMGGGVISMFAGIKPDLIKSAVIIEGIHVPDRGQENIPEWTQSWLADLEKWADRSPKPVASVDEALRRFLAATGDLPREIVLPRVKRLLVRHKGALYWRYDPRHRARFALPFLEAVSESYWQKISAPVVLVEGTQSPFRGLADGRKKHFRNIQATTLQGGHFLHWESPEKIASLLTKQL